MLSSLRALGEPLPRDDAVHCTVASGSARLGASRSAAPPTDSGNSRYSNLGILKILLRKLGNLDFLGAPRTSQDFLGVSRFAFEVKVYEFLATTRILRKS